MKISKLFLFFVSLTPFAFAAPVKPSRASWKDCKWQSYEFKKPGVSFLFQECKNSNAHYEITVKGDWIEEHRPSDDKTFGSHQIIQLFEKSASQTLDEAIQEKIISKLMGEAKKDCKPVSPKKSLLADKRKIVRIVIPTGDYAKKIAKEPVEGPRGSDCGQYGYSEGEVYFEYHPEESKTKFAFVIYGMDEPLFDENSIRFLPTHNP